MSYRHLISHDAIYDSRYYATDVEGPAASSAPDISRSITSDLQPHTVVDVGCGTGALLEVLKENGCQVFGLEYSEAALQPLVGDGVGDAVLVCAWPSAPEMMPSAATTVASRVLVIFTSLASRSGRSATRGGLPPESPRERTGPIIDRGRPAGRPARARGSSRRGRAVLRVRRPGWTSTPGGARPATVPAGRQSRPSR